MAVGMDDVRDPHKWNKFIQKMRERAKVLSSNARSALYLEMDLGVRSVTLGSMQRMHAAIYKLCRLARTEDCTMNRKEIVNLYNSLIYGPKDLRELAFKIVDRIE